MSRRRNRKQRSRRPAASVPPSEMKVKGGDVPVVAQKSKEPPAGPVGGAPVEASMSRLARRASVQVAVVALALGFLVVNAVVAARTNTPTPDEFVYVPAGLYHLQTGDLTFDSTNPPLMKMLMAFPLVAMDLKIDLDPRHRDNSQGWGPWIFGTSFMRLNPALYLDAFFAARLVVVAIAVVLGLLLFLRARELLSPVAALAVIVLYATTSPLIAHSAVATLDLAVTALLFAALLTTARFATTRQWGWAVVTGALFGFAFVVKGTAALLAPLVPLLVAIEWGDWKRDGLIRFVVGGGAMAVAAWVAILASYGFQGFPLPAPLVEGVSFQLAASSAGEFPAFLGGRWSQTGWWYYYLYALVLKTPLASLLLFVAGTAAVVRRRTRWADDLWIVLPPLLLIYLLSFHYAKDYGIRYLLPAFPFLLLLAGRGIDLLLAAGQRLRVVVALLLAWQVAACAVAAPHHLAYFNELAAGPDRARHLLLDSNLDWGQDLGRLKNYLDAHEVERVCLGYFGHVDPAIYGIDYTLAPSVPTPGLCAISANFLGGYPYAITYAGDRILGVRAGMWTWFDRLEPVARVGRSIYVYDVTEDDVARLAAEPAPKGAAFP